MNQEEREMLKQAVVGMPVRDAVIVLNELINHRDTFKIIPIYKSKQEAKWGCVQKFLKDGQPEFLKACEVAGLVLGINLKPTKRQASKWLAGKGAAWKFGRG